MKKLVAILCVVAMMIMAVSAFAAPSASSTVTVYVDGAAVEVERVDPADIADADVKKAVEAVNEEGGVTPEEVATILEGADSAQAAAVKNYSFTSQFQKIDVAGETDIEIEGTTADTLLMFIDADGNLIIIAPNADGTFTIPGPGLFAVIDPTP